MQKFFQRHKPFAIAAVLLLAMFVFAAGYNLYASRFWPGHPAPQAPLAVSAAPVGTVNKPVRMDRAGTIGNATSVPVNSDYAGRLSEVYVKEGQSVKAGQPLLKLEGYSAASESEAPMPAPSVSTQAQDSYDSALNEFNRLQKLYDIGAIPRRQLDNAAARLQEAKDRLANGQGNSPGAAPAVLTGSATIEAPADGIVMGLSASAGQVIQAGQQVLALGSGQDLEIVVRLEQNDLYTIHLGTPVAIEAANQTIAGQVSRIDPEVTANQIAAFLAHVKLADNPGGFLKPGMSVPVHLDTGKTEAVAAVPASAIVQDEQGQPCVYLAVDGAAVRQPIAVGQTVGDLVELVSNLPPGALVITGSLAEIKSGDKISIEQ